MSDDTAAWVATEDPTNGELPTTEFIGSKKDLEQTVAPQESDGSGLGEEVPE